MKSLATIEQYKRYNRVENNNSVGISSKGFDDSRTNESDEEIQLYLDAASQTIRNYVGKDFTLMKYTENQFLNHIGRYRTSERIKQVININSGGFDIDKDYYKTFGNVIVSDRFFCGNIIVEYIGGYEEVPADIVQSTIHLASMLSRKKTRIGVQSVTNGDNTTVYQTVDLPADIKLILDDYRSWITSGSVIIEREEWNG